MVDRVLNTHGEAVYASLWPPYEWDRLKEQYSVGDFLMPCCNSNAIPKTSPNGLQFFAHHSDECTTSPESLWHIASKDSVLKALYTLNISATQERPGGDTGRKWTADVYFELEHRKIAIEIQHSYQHLKKYFSRQQRYVESGVECYWVLYPPRYLTLSKSTSQYRLKNEFNNAFPSDPDVSIGLGQIETLPTVMFDPEKERSIYGPDFFSATTIDWIEAIVSKRFYYQPEGWKIYNLRQITLEF